MFKSAFHAPPQAHAHVQFADALRQPDSLAGAPAQRVDDDGGDDEVPSPTSLAPPPSPPHPCPSAPLRPLAAPAHGRRAASASRAGRTPGLSRQRRSAGEVDEAARPIGIQAGPWPLPPPPLPPPARTHATPLPSSGHSFCPIPAGRGRRRGRGQRGGGRRRGCRGRRRGGGGRRGQGRTGGHRRRGQVSPESRPAPLHARRLARRRRPPPPPP